MSEWREVRLGNHIKTNIQSVGKNYPFEKILYLDTGSITENRIEKLQEFDFKKAPSRAKRLVRNEDIIYSSVRPNQLHYGFIKNPVENLVVSTGFIVIDCDKEAIQPKYLFYYLTTDTSTEYLHSIAEASTSAYPSLKPSDIEALDVELPPLPEQKAIAEVLSSLDDKIDLLHRQNKTLEQMAETLFRQWFVEEAREDWEEGVLDDILSVKGGTTPSTKNPEFWGGDIHWTTPKDLSTSSPLFLMNTLRKITEKGLEKINSGLLPKGTLLLSSRAPVGYLAFAEIPLAINQGYIAILDNKGFSSIFIYLWLRINMEYVKSHANGSTFQEISKTSFKALNITIPPEDLRLKFDEIVRDNFHKIKTNAYQIHTLQSLRDTLLPKLMNGEVRVNHDRELK